MVCFRSLILVHNLLVQVTHKLFIGSQEACLFPQKHEWALLGGRRISERSLSEHAGVPELEPFVVVRAMLDVVLVSVMLEEKLLVTPKGWRRLRARDQPADAFLGAVVLRRAVISENLEHGSVLRNNLELLMEVVLVLIGPAINIVRLNINLEGPVRVLLLVAKLVEFGQLHDRHGSGMVGDLVQVFTDRLSGAIVVHLSEDVRPSVLEEVEGRLSIESKHGKPVSRGHAVSKELHSVAWSSFRGLGCRLREL